MRNALRGGINVPCFLLFSIFLGIASNSNAKDDIIWLGADFPPAFINKGSNANNGYIDKTEQYIWGNLLDYDHTKENANFTRILTALKNRKNICSAALFKTPEREKFIEYSKPTYLILSNGIIVKRSNLKKIRRFIKADNVVSLYEVLQSGGVTLGISKSRSYGNQLNTIIDDYKSKDSIYQRGGSNQLEGLLQMLRLNRIDFIIGYFNELQYIARQHGMHSNELVFYPVAEMETSYSLGYIGCSKSQLGKEVISKVNLQLKPIRNTFLEHYGFWLNKSMQNLHRNLTDKQFKE